MASDTKKGQAVTDKCVRVLESEMEGVADVVVMMGTCAG